MFNDTLLMKSYFYAYIVIYFLLILFIYFNLFYDIILNKILTTLG